MPAPNSETTPTPSPVPTAADVVAQAAADRVANWWPRRVYRRAPEPPAVKFTRLCVSQVTRFRDAKHAGQLLGVCYPFALWLLGTGHPLDPATAFATDLLTAYRTEALADRPRGSQDAVSSNLRLIAGAIAALPAPGTTVPNPAPAPVPAERIEDILTSYVPEAIAPSRFARIESLVRIAARATNPSSPDRATRAIRNGSYLAAWVEHQGRPLRIDVVFHPDTVEEFAAALAISMNTASAATIASSLRSMSRTLLPDLAPARRTVHGRPAASNLPYTDAEITYLLRKAGAAHSTKHRRHLTALICLGLGVGPQHSEQDWVRPTDVVRQDDGRVTVTLTRPTTQTTRTITALDPYADRLVDLAQSAVDAGDQWLLGGGPARRNRASRITQLTDWTTGIDTVRLRNTYLLALTQRPMTIEALFEASGVTRLITFDQLLENQAIARLETASLDTPTLVADAELEADAEPQDDAEPGDEQEQRAS